MNEPQGPRNALREWNENGRLYRWGGAISSIISWLLVLELGLLAVYCGSKLYVEEGASVSSALIAGVGGLGVVTWLVYLVMIT